MILSLLKNRGLRLQLLVGLLLVLWTFPEPSDGTECYVCDNNEIDDCEETTDCPEGFGCFKVKGVGDGKPEVTKGCIKNVNAECLERELGSDCKTATSFQGVIDMGNAAKRCKDETITAIVEQLGGGRGRKHTSTFALSVCSCDSDLCNTGSSGGHPTSVIITAVLTVALYNYT